MKNICEVREFLLIESIDSSCDIDLNKKEIYNKLQAIENIIGICLVFFQHTCC